MVETSGSAARRNTAADRARLAGVLARAFADDPVFAALFPPTIRRREARLQLLFRLDAARSRRRGGTWTTGDTDGAAVWFPPGRWPSRPWEDVVQTPGAMAAFGRQLAFAGRVRSVLEDHHRALPDHWYLLYLGVDPSRQAQGLGSALLRPVLEECDRTGTPAYLEATCDRNRTLYRRHGFVDRPPLALPEPSPPMFPMWRDPA
jgi:GNAT superfamily N-acetyltransferase